jgi:hypothetical protein
MYTAQYKQEIMEDLTLAALPLHEQQADTVSIVCSNRMHDRDVQAERRIKGSTYLQRKFVDRLFLAKSMFPLQYIKVLMSVPLIETDYSVLPPEVH